MSKSILENIAPGFKRTLAILPMDIAIIKSFDDEKTHRKMKGGD